MTAPPFLQLYIADYAADTLHLTTEQNGAYFFLLMAMWRQKCRLPNDEKILARIARLTPRKWKAIASEVLAFFDEHDGFITQKRLLAEYRKYEDISEKRRESGRAGGRKSLNNNDYSNKTETIDKQEKSKCSSKKEANAKQVLKHSQISESEFKKHNPDGLCKKSDELIVLAATAASKKKTPKEVLETVLPPDRAADILDHRRKLRKPLSIRASELLAKKFAEAPETCGLSPEDAADQMIVRGWQGFEPDWINNSSQNGSPRDPPRKGRYKRGRATDAITGLMEEWAAAENENKTAESSAISIDYQRFPAIRSD